MIPKPTGIRIPELSGEIEALRQKVGREDVHEIVAWLEAHAASPAEAVIILKESLGITLVQAKTVLDKYGDYRKKKIEPREFFTFCEEILPRTPHEKRK